MAMDKWEREHRKYVAMLEQRILAIYEAAAQEAAAIGTTVGELGESVFSFDGYPITTERINALMKQMHDNMEVALVDGVNSQWTLANNKNNELARRVYGGALASLTLKQQRRYFSNNEEARRAFLARKVDGLSLSDRVWRYTDIYKNELELGLDVGIRAGLSADEMSRELRSYLRYPDKLFRRVRDEHGQLVLSQRAKAFHPGQGVYRSSYMNARRLAATETNMAYRTADYDRYQDLDFVVGVEVHLSTNHTCKGVKGVFFDICDELQGKYPKDFKFTGWHPHCRCYVTTILKTPKEIEADNQRIMQGLEPLEKSENEVKDIPDKFVQWMMKNEERSKYLTNIPYFIKDNPQYVPAKFINGFGTLSRQASPSIVGNAIDAMKKILDPNHVTIGEVKDIINNFADNNPSYFNGGLKGVVVTSSKGITSFMSNTRSYNRADGKYDGAGNILTITNKDIRACGVTFNPFERLREALSAIKQGKKLTFQQEYAVESLWHEIRHAGAVGWKNVRKKNPTNCAVMECINQFCARRSYGEFLKALGGKAYNQAAVISDGYGYKYYVENFEVLLDALSIDKRSAYVYFKDKIMTTPYENIIDEVDQFLARRGNINPIDSRILLSWVVTFGTKEFKKQLKGVLQSSTNLP